MSDPADQGDADSTTGLKAALVDEETGELSDDAKREVLRAVAAELRGPDASPEAERIAATVQRVSDLYDPAEDTSPEAIYRNMRTIFQVVEQGGMDR